MNTKLKCLLLDDELPGLTYLKMLCEQLPEVEVVKAFNSPELFLKEVSTLEFDFCIMDIEMPGMNGLQVANLLNGKPVIFTTAYKDYAAEAFDLDAIDYIIKPIKRERLQQAITKFANRKSETFNERKYIQLNTNKGKALIFIDQIAFVGTSEMDGRDKVAHLIDSSIYVLKNLSFEKLQELLPPNTLCRINKREMIALKVVSFFSFDEITTNILDENGKIVKLALSEVYRSEFLQRVKI